MAQPLSDIYNSLNSAYQPQRDLYQSQIANVGQQTQGQISGLNQQEQNAFTDIKNQANNNGMFYSGAPVQEQQKYVGGTYLPALANLQNNANNQTYGLQQALAGVGVNQTNAAQGIYQNQVSQDQQQNYYNQQLAMQNAQNQYMRTMYGGMSGGGGGTATAAAAPATNPLTTDIANAFQGYQGQPKFYTEKTIIPALQARYGNTPAVAQAVYQYRKANFGS